MQTVQKAVWIAKEGGLPECVNELPPDLASFGATFGAPSFDALSMIEGHPDWMRALAWALVNSLWLGLFAVLFHAGASRCLPSGRVRLRYAAAFGALLAVPVAVMWTLAHELLLRAKPMLQLRATSEPLELGALHPHAPSLWDSARAWCAGWLAPLEPWLAAIWLAGAALLAARLCAMWMWGRRRRTSELTPAHATWQVHVARLGRRAGLRRRVRLYTHASIDVPMVIGRMAPRVVVPERALIDMPREELDALLLHELAHVRRRDGWFALAQGLIEALFFYHPAVWWLSARVRSEREHCCDEAALAAACDRRSLARALFTLETCRGAHPHRLAPLALAASDGSLLARIQRIAGVGERHARGEQRVLWSGAACVGLIGVAVGAIPARVPWQELRVHIAIDARREGTIEGDAHARAARMMLFGRAARASTSAALPEEFEQQLLLTDDPAGEDSEDFIVDGVPGRFVAAKAGVLIQLVGDKLGTDPADDHGASAKRRVIMFKRDRGAAADLADAYFGSGTVEASGVWTTSPASSASDR